MASEQALEEEGIPLTRSADLIMILNTPKGRGVFAARDIPARTTLEVCPMMVFSPRENEEYIRHTSLYFYTYNWIEPATEAETSETEAEAEPNPTSGKRQTTMIATQALPLGLGALFNHSRRGQNVGWSRNVAARTITYVSLRDIRRGEELCISYGETERLGFIDADVDIDADIDAGAD